jgi:hypothetical protein
MTATKETRAPLRPGTGVCECAGCGERFKSVTSFDRHRTGPQDARRCLSPAEMRARGMSVNAHGQWVASVRAPAARAA